jgi:hypothetical protein
MKKVFCVLYSIKERRCTLVVCIIKADLKKKIVFWNKINLTIYFFIKNNLEIRKQENVFVNKKIESWY